MVITSCKRPILIVQRLDTQDRSECVIHDKSWSQGRSSISERSAILQSVVRCSFFIFTSPGVTAACGLPSSCPSVILRGSSTASRALIFWFLKFKKYLLWELDIIFSVENIQVHCDYKAGTFLFLQLISISLFRVYQTKNYSWYRCNFFSFSSHQLVALKS